MSHRKVSRFILVEWEDVNNTPITEGMLGDFLKAKTKETPLLRWGNKDRYVILIFKKEQDAEFLKSKLIDDTFWKIKNIQSLDDECRVKVSNLPERCRRVDHIYNFFSNKNTCGKVIKSEIKVSRVHADLDWCVLTLGSPDEARKLIKDQRSLHKMDAHTLTLEEFYESLNHLDTGSNQSTVQPQTVSIGGIDSNKLEFLKQCYETQLQAHVNCDKVTWREIKDVQIEFHFQNVNIAIDRRRFVDEKKDKANEVIKSIEVCEKKVKSNLWETVLEKITHPKTVMVKQNKPNLIIVGLKDSEEIKKTITAIDNVKEPIQRITKSMPSLEEMKMKGFQKFEINTEAVEKFGVEVNIKNGKIELSGVDDKVREAETWILETVNDLTIRTYTFPSSEYGRILSTPMMLDTIAEDSPFPTTQGQYDITDTQVVVYIRGKHDPDTFHKQIEELIVEHKISRKGAISSNENFNHLLKKAQGKYDPYVIVTHTIKQDEVLIKIVCGKSYLDLMDVEIRRVLNEIMIEKETIALPHHVFDYLIENTMDKIRSKIKNSKINEAECFHVDSTKKSIIVEGCRAVRQTLRNTIMATAGEVQTSWRSLEKEGITKYFSEKENVKYLKDIQKTYSCKVELATKLEMKKNNVSCMVLLNTGQVVLAAAGTLARPKMGVDAIVNPTSISLQHNSNVSTKLMKTAGQQINMELIDFVETNGNLQLGQVYVTGPGRIPCQKLIHTTLFDHESSRLYDETVVQIAMENLFEALKSDNLKSVAMTIPANDFIMTFLDAVTGNLVKFPDVKEVFFYDINPNIIRQMKSVIDQKFGGRCYHLPVENVGLGQGQMTLGKSKYTMERTGKRTLPLPGGKKISVEWDVMSDIKADVLVCPTPTEPNPSGEIFDNLKKKSGMNLGAECSKEFQKIKPIKDGALVETNAGKIGGCNKIYHIKVKGQWPGTEEYKQYIQTCLKEAVRKNVKSIALPPMGTADCRYPGKDVASTLIRTVGEFIKLHTSSELEEVKIIISKTDTDLTNTFENVIQGMYSQRPHRLKAVIEETITGVIEKDEEKAKPAANVGIPQPMYTRQKSFIAAPSPKPQRAMPAGTTKFTVSHNASVTVIPGDLSRASGDVIVCTTSDFPSLNGQISKALIKAGGAEIQNSLTKAYKGYPNDRVPDGSPGKLKCKKVYYIKMQDYKNPQDLQVVFNSVQKCLKQAENGVNKSVVFPALGTGGFKFPAQGCADEMCKAIKDFFGKGPKSLTTVDIVVYHADRNTVQIFQSIVSQYFGQGQVQNQGQGGQAYQAAVPPPNIDMSGSTWHIPGTMTTVELKPGNIEKWRADVIVDTTVSFPNLTGAIPNALCQAAGKELKQECQNYKGQVNTGNLAITKGYKLSCKNVFHYVMPSWNQQNGDQIVQTCVKTCLDSLLQQKLSSIAMPTLGTGGLNYDARVVATSLYKAAEAFGKSHQGNQIRITVVMFPQSNQVNAVFMEKLQPFIRQQPRPVTAKRPVSAAPKKAVHFANSTTKDNNFIPVKQRGDFLLVRFTSINNEKIKDAFTDIEKKVKTDSSEVQPIDLEDKDKEILGDESKKKEIKKFDDVYNVRIDIDLEKKKISIHGMGESRIECRQKIMEALQAMKKQKNEAFIGQHVYKYLEWCYTEDKGNVLVPYQSHLTFLLEENHKGGATMEFKDSDENTYIVNFNKMEEYRKSDDGKIVADTMVRIERRDLMTEDLKPPSIWVDMDGNLKLVTLQRTDPEYQTVEQDFSSTLGGLNHKIKEIKRIQNLHLYQQYETKKKQVQTKIQGGAKVERLLWHGVSKDNELSITSNGFNRSYSGQTHAGQVWYGHGCYFAVKSQYASGDVYSQPDNNGIKRVFQVGVLTGNTVKLARGYDKRYAPTMPKSDTDRYDSVCDDDNNPEEFVIFNDTQAYPKYILYFN